MKRIRLWILVWAVAASGLAGGYCLLPKKQPVAFSYVLIKYATMAVRGHAFEDAVEFMTTLVRYHGDNAYARTLLAQAQDYQIGEMEEGPERDELIQASLENYHAAMDLAPRFLAPRIGLADLLRDLDRPDEARALLDQALEHNPYSDEAHEVYAHLLLDLEDLEGASEHAVYTLDERYDPSLLGREIHFEFEEKFGLSRTEWVLVRYRTTSRIIDPGLYQFFGPDSWHVEDMVWGMSLVDVYDQTPDIHVGTFPASEGKEILARCGLEPVSLEILSVEPTDPPELPVQLPANQ